MMNSLWNNEVNDTVRTPIRYQCAQERKPWAAAEAAATAGSMRNMEILHAFHRYVCMIRCAGFSHSRFIFSAVRSIEEKKTAHTHETIIIIIICTGFTSKFGCVRVQKTHRLNTMKLKLWWARSKQAKEKRQSLNAVSMMIQVATKAERKRR